MVRWPKGIDNVNAIKIATELTLIEGSSLDYAGGPILITRVLQSQEPFPAVFRGTDRLALETEEGRELQGEEI